MKYIVSQWGNGLSVGLIGTPDEVESDKNLAHNLFGAKSYDELFNGRINFKSIFYFYKFLLYKHALPCMDKYKCSLRMATKATKERVKQYSIIKHNFMSQVDRLPMQHKMGYYNDGDCGGGYED